jgi:hypothetical protein
MKKINQNKLLIFKNNTIYYKKFKKINQLINYQLNICKQSLTKLSQLIVKKKIKKEILKKFIIKIKIKGVGLKIYKYRKLIILDYNQRH